MFAYTPLTGPNGVQPTDNMMRNLSCLAKVYKGRFNVGFMDYRISEKVFENYDVKLDYGKTTPALFIFDNGKTYPCKTGSLSAVKIIKFIEDYKDGECQYCGQETLLPRTELQLYIEYAKNDLINSRTYVDTYNYLLTTFNETWVHENILKPYLGPSQGRKAVGSRLIFSIMLPVAWSIITGLACAVYGLIVCCIWCNQKKGDNKVATSAEKEKSKE